MRYLRPLIAVVVLVGFPAAALASTPATQSQKRALMKAAAASTMSAPSRAPVGARITVHAKRLKPGRYTLLLAVALQTGGASPISCSARVGSALARAGTVTISGKLPSRLTCRMGEGSVEGHVSVHPGKYVLSLGILLPPAGFRGGSFVKRTIQLVK